MEKNERRQSSSQLIEHMLSERKQLLTLLFQFTDEEINSNKNHPDEDSITEFCQVLVDYIAAGHFGLYDRIVEGRERRKAVADLAEEVYPEIERTTQISLEINDKYETVNKNINSGNLKKDLSILGEALTTRIELEDRLIALMLKNK